MKALAYSVIAILFAAAGWFLFRQSRAQRGDSSVSLSTSSTYFSSDYFTARTRFRAAVRMAGGQTHSISLDSKGPANEELTIDVGWIGAEKPQRVLVHQSGLHGVEGFAGSAIQLELLERLPPLAPDTALVFTHVLNPFGMAWLRRFNESNVDLNRNFMEGRPYRGAPPLYPVLDPIINPPGPPSWDLFLLKAGWIILRHGFTSVKQATAGGQYEYPKGLFFGGKQLEQGPAKYRAFLAERLAGAERVTAIDVHTGLGKYGEDVLLVRNEKYAEMRATFGERVQPLVPQDTVAYDAAGAIDNLFSAVFGSAELYFTAQEFGTENPVSVLHALREENRWHHYGGGALDHLTKQRVKEAFDPPNEDWRMKVLVRGREFLTQNFQLLANGSAASE